MNNISVIKNAIASGVNPYYSPEISAEFLCLVDEYGIELFDDELKAHNFLAPENESDVK